MITPIVCFIVSVALTVLNTWLCYETNKRHDGYWIVSPFLIGPPLFGAMISALSIYMELRK